MKFRLIVLLSVSFAMPSFAQVMEWSLKPGYKDIAPMGGDLFKLQASDGKWGVFNAAVGKVTVEARYDSITPLVEGRALILGSNGQDVYGYINEKGTTAGTTYLVDPEGDIKFLIDKRYPYFSGGLLPISSIEDTDGLSLRFAYYDNMINKHNNNFKYYYASPSCNGQAMVKTKTWTNKTKYEIVNVDDWYNYVRGARKVTFFSNPDTNGVFIYCTKDNKVRKARLMNVFCPKKDKLRDFVNEYLGLKKIEDIEDLNPDGYAIQIIDIEAATSTHFIPLGDDTLRFDNAMRYCEGNSETQYPLVIRESKENLKYEKVNGLYNITYDSNVLLKEQFQTVRVYNDNYAVVTMKDGYKGILKYNPNGKFTISTQTKSVEFYHKAPTQIPVDVSCEGFASAPCVTLSCGDSIFAITGSGRVDCCFYNPHAVNEETTYNDFGVHVEVDGLDYGTDSLRVFLSRKEGYSWSCSIPEYSDTHNEGTVKVRIESLNGVPHSSATAFITGTKGAKIPFNGRSVINYSFKVDVPVRGTKEVKVNVSVKEDGCPTWSRSKTGNINSLANR